jgi:hypothetical protein
VIGMNTSTASPPTSGRRVVRRRAQPTLDRAYEIVLAEMPVELRPLIIRYVDNMREGIEIRSALTTAMTERTCDGQPSTRSRGPC